MQNSTVVFQLNISNNIGFCASISRPNAKPQNVGGNAFEQSADKQQIRHLMKISNLFLILSLFFISCKEETKKSTEIQNDTQIEKVSKKDSIQKKYIDTIINPEITQDTLSEINEEQNYKKSLDFEKFATEKFSVTKKAKLDFSSNENAKYFKTRIIDAYKSDKTDFASYYIGVIFGCGASCINGFIIDVRDGKIYNLPLGEEHSCLFAEDRAICEQNSRLFISGICKENPEDEKIFYDAFLWNETKKIFEKINENEIISKYQ